MTTTHQSESAHYLIRREAKRFFEDRAGLTTIIEALKKRGEQFPLQSNERSNLLGAAEHIEAFRDSTFP